MVGLLVVGAAAMLLTRYRRLNVSPLPMRVTVMLTRRSTRELSDRMAALRREGCSLARISEETNISISGISLELRRLDDPSLRRPPSRARQLSDTLVGLRERGLAMSQIAEETGLSVSSISAELLRRGVNTPGRRVRRARGSAGRARDGSRTAAVGQAGAPDASWQMDGRVRELRMQGGSVQQIAARVGAPPEWVWARLTAMHLTRPVRPHTHVLLALWHAYSPLPSAPLPPVSPCRQEVTPFPHAPPPPMPAGAPLLPSSPLGCLRHLPIYGPKAGATPPLRFDRTWTTPPAASL